MKISKFSKHSDNKYSLVLENGNVLELYDDVIVKYDLIRTKMIQDSEYELIVNYNKKLESYYSALKYIEKKLRTEKEIDKYLSKDYDKDVIIFTIEKLKKDGYLNNKQYIKSFIDDKVNFYSIGPIKIKNDLINLGFYDEDINFYLEDIEDDVWKDKVKKLVEKKIRTNHTLGNNKLKDKLIYDICNRGFYKAMVEDVISSCDFKDSFDILEKEYKKLFVKLSRKFAGDNLRFQIKQKLLMKGFSVTDIDEIIKKMNSN